MGFDFKHTREEKFCQSIKDLIKPCRNSYFIQVICPAALVQFDGGYFETIKLYFKQLKTKLFFCTAHFYPLNGYILTFGMGYIAGDPCGGGHADSKLSLSTQRGNYATSSDQFAGAAPATGAPCCGRPHTGTGQAQGLAPTIFILYLAAYLTRCVLRICLVQAAVNSRPPFPLTLPSPPRGERG
jgi:hypothetical protein